MRPLPLSSCPAACAAFLPLLLLGACGAGSAPEAPPQAGVDTAAGVTGTARAAPPPPVETVHAEGYAATAAEETIRLAPAFTPLVAGTINAAPYWPAWYGNGKPVDGVGCLVNGNWHRHALVSIYSDGRRLGVPDGIGRVHAGCYHAYEMHNHDVTGIVHMEADAPRLFRLGQWFSLWGQPLSRDGVAGLPGPVRFYVIDNGTILRYDGDPGRIQLLPHREVLIVSGAPITVVPKYQWPPGI